LHDFQAALAPNECEFRFLRFDDERLASIAHGSFARDRTP